MCRGVDVPTETADEGGSPRWQSWLAPALAAFVGAVAGMLLQQWFLPRTALVEERAALRRSVVEDQYPSLKRLQELAELGLRRDSGTVFSYQIIYRTPRGTELRRDTLSTFAPTLFRDSVLLERWRRLAKPLRGAERVNPSAKISFRRLDQLVEDRGLAVSDSVFGDEWDYRSIQEWFRTNERLLGQVDALLSLEF